jgi:hypothetical protein
VNEATVSPSIFSRLRLEALNEQTSLGDVLHLMNIDFGSEAPTTSAALYINSGEVQ